MNQSYLQFIVTLSAILVSLVYLSTPDDESTARPTQQTNSLQESDDPVDFAFDVKPILSDKCFFCHGPDAKDVRGELRLDIPPEQQDRDPAIVAGSREDSLVWERLVDDVFPMPPTASHKTLTDDEKEIIGRWIDQGAKYEQHWAYDRIKNVEVPKTNDDWAVNPIDHFLLNRMRIQDLKPAPEASPETLIRRLYLDLVGLPPSPDEVIAFTQNPSNEAYLAIVDKLLQDPRFGEHWAAWWLDLVRYADSVGFHGDQSKPAWLYRDWVVNAFNDGMPFDEFTRKQLAGDVISNDQPSPDLNALIGSAYNRLSPETAEFGAQPKEYLAIYAADRVSNFGEVWLGSSTGCARCHDHKYDPFTIEDFYSLSAVFADINQPVISNRGLNPQWLPYTFVPQNDEQLDQVQETETRYRELISQHPTAGPYEAWTISYSRGAQPQTGDWKKEFDELLAARNELAKSIPTVSVTQTVNPPRPIRILPRGNWQDESGELVQPRPPEFLGGQVQDDSRFNRLDLANWLFEDSNPLTSRVFVNRLWARFFGRGISSNTLDFGNQGAPPTHRKLIDWIATEFRNSGWDAKHVMRLIVTSRAYRQSSSQSPAQLDADPDNLWFARQTPKRLSAEVLRDQALFVSGLLVKKVGGKSVFPYQPKRHWDALNFPKRVYQPSTGDDLYRRSLYTWVQRTFPHPAMTVFDAPNRERCTADRADSNTPLQSLTTLNETLFVEAARNFAARVMLEKPDLQSRIDRMFLHALFRKPTEKERKVMTKLFTSQQNHFANNADEARAFCNVGESESDPSLDQSELAAYAALARVIFNLHELVTRQ